MAVIVEESPKVQGLAPAEGNSLPDLAHLTKRLIAFRDERDWRQFHSAKNLMVSVALEAAELLELTQWKSDEQVEAQLAEPRAKARLGEECADVLLYLLLLCERAGIDLAAAADAKINENAGKYPIEKSKGTALKYNEFR